MRINILGNGAWGSALGRLLTSNGHKVSFWDKKTQIEPLDLIVISIPTQEIRGVLNNFGHKLKKAVIVNSSKGIERKTHQIPVQIVKEVLGNEIKYFTLIGPSFAKEVDLKMPTLVNVGNRSGEAQEICDLFETDFFRVRPTKSVKALELAGALKNVYAIACGITDGLGFQVNTRAKLITIAYEEYQKLARSFGYEIDDEARPGILGDLVLTCSSIESRNFRFGKNLAKHSVKESVETVNSTIEGYNTSFSILNFSEKSPMPLAEFVLRIIEEDNPRKIANKFAEFVKKI
jgi:glycerol-3-phosphate dehydrogenase (NAD(P)+)